jgi:O-antigen/teichoic acid export membrane protein
MISKFIKDSAIYTFGTVLTRGIAIIMVPIYTRFLNPSEYGLIDILAIFANLINVSIALEINQGFGRHFSETSNEIDKKLYSSTAFWFVFIVYTTFLIISMLLSSQLCYLIIGTQFSNSIFQIALLSIWSGGLFLFLQNQLRWYLLPKKFITASVTFTSFSYGITIILMVAFKIGVVAVFWGSLVSYVLAGLLSWFYSKNNYRFLFDWEKLKEMLRFSIPLVPASFGTILLLYTDRIAIKNLLTLNEVGIFGIAYRFAAIISLVLSGFQIALAPLIYQNYKMAETPKEVEKIFRVFTFIILIFIMFLSIFSKELLEIITTPAYFRANEIIPIICFATLFFSMNIFTPGLPIAKKTKKIAAINISMGLLNIILNYLLIPIWGIIGSSISTLFCSILIFLLNMIYSQKYYYIPHKWEKIIFAFLIVSMLIILTRTFEGLILSRNIIIVLKISVLFIASYIISKFLIEIKEIENLKLLLKKYLSFKTWKN